MTTTQKSIPVVRIKIAAEGPARRDNDDRPLIGYRDGLSTEELWERGRQAWKLKAEKVLAAELLVIAHAGIIRAVGTIEGVTKVGDRLAITGTPFDRHPLIGQEDPLHNTSQNPITYGSITIDAA